MRTRHSLGLIGSVALILGVFAPILSLPIVGSVNYFSNGSGDGTIVLLVALISLLLTLRRRYEWLLTIYQVYLTEFKRPSPRSSSRFSTCG